jgi:hypothetical protein
MRDDNTEPRDNQQMQDDNQQSGESVRQNTPNQASNKEPAEGSRATVGAPRPMRGDEGPQE